MADLPARMRRLLDKFAAPGGERGSGRVRTLAPAVAYARWAASYGLEPNEFQRLEAAAIARLFPDVRQSTVLDVGCGKGRLAALALERGAARAVAGDFTLDMLTGPGAVRRSGLTRLALEVRALPFEAATFEAVTCGLVLGHCPELGRPMEEMVRLLRPGGWLLISDFHPQATLRGWQRTFVAHGRSHAIEQHVHLLSEYERIAARLGLTLEGLEEPTWEKQPVVFVWLARKRVD